MIQNAKEEKHAERDAEVNQALDIFGKQKQILRHIHLGEDGCVAQKRGHTLVGGFAEERIDQIAAEQIDRVMWSSAPEKLREHQTHNQQHYQRRQQAPNHAQYRAFIFLFKISFNQLFEKKLVRF